MTPEMKEKIERRREQLYFAVKNADMGLYRRAVEVGSMVHATTDRDELAYQVECACMELIADCLGLS